MNYSVVLKCDGYPQHVLYFHTRQEAEFFVDLKLDHSMIAEITAIGEEWRVINARLDSPS